MNYLKKRIQAFGFAFSGLNQAFKSEKNFQLQLIIAFLVIIISFYFSISKVEWLFILSCITLVLTLELINSAIEKLCDLYSSESNLKIKFIKDVTAGAVLLCSLFSLIVGCIIFYPYLKAYLAK